MFAKRCVQHVVRLGVSWRQALVSFLRPLRIPSIYQCLFYFSMSETNILTGAHDIVVSGTINAARVVRETIRFSKSKLMAWLSCRLISITTLAKERYPMPLFHLCQTRALGSQAGQRLLQNSRNIFLLIPMKRFRRETTFYCMEWGVLEKLKFA